MLQILLLVALAVGLLVVAQWVLGFLFVLLALAAGCFMAAMEAVGARRATARDPLATE